MKKKVLLIFSLITIFVVAFFILDQEVVSVNSGSHLYKLADQDPNEFRRQLFQFSRDQSIDIVPVARDLFDHSNPIVRSALAECLGFFEDSQEIIEYLEAFIKDSDVNIRKAVLRGLVRNPSEARRDLIYNVLEGEKISLKEQVEVYIALGRISEGQELQTAIDWLIYLSESGSHHLHHRALAGLSSLAPQDKKLLALLRKKLLANKNKNEVILAIQHLAALKDKWLKSKLPELIESPDSEIRVTAFRALGTSCHRNRWELLSKSLDREYNKTNILAIINIPRDLLGPKALLFLQSILQKGVLAEDLLGRAKDNLAFIAQNSKKRVCKDGEK